MFIIINPISRLASSLFGLLQLENTERHSVFQFTSSNSLFIIFSEVLFGFTHVISLLVVKTAHNFALFQQVGAPARVGLVAPVDVVVPPGNTGLDPSQTSFFQVNLLIYIQVS